MALSLDVDVTGEGYLKAGVPDGDDPRTPTPPGKVEQYRFMSFYLPPSRRNGAALRGNVDPTWLAMSTDPAAQAMREMDTASPAWRVLHRVTYVERTPPQAGGGALHVKKAVKAAPANIAGNVELLRLVDAQIGDDRPTPAVVGAAVAAVINPTPDESGGCGPAVLEHTVPWWSGFLDAARSGDTEAAALLHRLTADTVDYCVDGYASGALPLEGAQAEPT